jgi:hypothetical protein
MTVAMDPFAGGHTLTGRDDSSVLLHSRTWDRWFIAGGAILVPIPILAFYLFRSLGLSAAACEDLVTLLVMVPLGGPHVFATYTRTFLNPRFAREDRWLFAGAWMVTAVVVTAAVGSAFLDWRIAGSPPIRFVLTFFFFWAGVHIVQQNGFLAAGLAARAPRRGSRWWGAVDYAVMLLALYPVSLFRMSMVNLGDASMASADPSALATKIVVAVSGSSAFADEYVFRIGRVAPFLPEFLRHPACWMLATVAFVAALVLFAIKTRRERAAGTLIRSRYQLVLWMAILGSLVPLFPNLDSAFQGMNAWHSFQYLGLLWLMNQRSRQRGEIRYPLFERLSAPDRPLRLYWAGIVGTIGLLAVVLLAGLAIETVSGGEFALFGHAAPRLDPATGNELYRPGAVLLAYYLIGMSVLLTHYLHDGFFFFRQRYIVGGVERRPTA